LNADDSSGRLTPIQRRSVWTFAGVGGAVLALLTVLQGKLSALHLFTEMKFAVSLLIGAVAALISLLQSSLGNRRIGHDQARALDFALVGSATRAAEFRDPIDLGATADLSHCEYRKRDEDADVRTAMEESGLCVVGPRGAGRRRAAFEALRAVSPNAKILCPVDANGLSTLLHGQDQLLFAISRLRRRASPRRAGFRFASVRARKTRRAAVIGRREVGPAILWLDDLERFLDGLDIDGLTRFLGKTVGDKPDEDHQPSAVRVVATMRDETHKRIVGAEDDVAHRARRLLALGRVMTISTLSQGEAAPKAAEPSLQPLVTVNGTLVVLLVIILVLVLWLLRSWAHHHGWTVPPRSPLRCRPSKPRCRPAIPPRHPRPPRVCRLAETGSPRPDRELSGFGVGVSVHGRGRSP
jgi:hypothetical protein